MLLGIKSYIFETVNKTIDLSDEFNALTNKQVWDKFYSYIADVLTVNKIPLDNVFFVNTPNFVIYISEIDKAIIQRPASYYTKLTTRNVIVEKSNSPNKKFCCYYDMERKSGDKILSKALSSMNVKLNWKKRIGEFSSMEALCKYIKSKSHIPLFFYVDFGFFDTLEKTKIIRIATLDSSLI